MSRGAIAVPGPTTPGPGSARSVAALERVADTAGEALVVTSGITIMLLLRALGADLGHVVAGPPNLSVSVVEGYPGGWRVTRAVATEV